MKTMALCWILILSLELGYLDGHLEQTYELDDLRSLNALKTIKRKYDPLLECYRKNYYERRRSYRRHRRPMCIRWNRYCAPWTSEPEYMCCGGLSCKCNLWGQNCRCTSKLWGR